MPPLHGRFDWPPGCCLLNALAGRAVGEAVTAYWGAATSRHARPSPARFRARTGWLSDVDPALASRACARRFRDCCVYMACVCDSSIRLRATPLPGPEGPSLVIVCVCVVTGYPHGPRTQLTSQATPPRVGRGRTYARQHTRASRHTERAQDSQSDRLRTLERAPKSHPCLRIATPPGAHRRTPPTPAPLALCPPSLACHGAWAASPRARPRRLPLLLPVAIPRMLCRAAGSRSVARGILFAALISALTP